MVIAALVVFLPYYLDGQLFNNLVKLLILFLAAFVINGVYVGLLTGEFFPTWLAVASPLVDVIWAVLLLVIAREYIEMLLPVLVFPPLIAGVRWSTEAGALTALPLLVGYGVVLVPFWQGNIGRPEVIRGLFSGLGAAVVLLAVGALPALYINRRIKLVEETAGEETRQENERLRMENKRYQLLSEMAVVMSSTLNYREVLRQTIDTLFAGMTEMSGEDESTVGMILLFEDAGELRVAIGRNIGRADQGRRVTSESGLIGRTIQLAETTVTYNVQKDKVLTAFASTAGSRSAICAPLRAGFSTYGVVLFCTTEPNFYKAEHKKLLTTFCNQAIIPLQNAQLFDDLRSEQQRILEKESEARRKLARDLHDGPTQSISAIAMRLNFIKMIVQNKNLDKAYEEIVKVEEIAQQTTQEIRTMLFAMRPVILETQGLVAALEQYAERLNANESFKVSVVNQGYNGELDAEAEGVVFAIVEEAVGNAKKHSRATAIRISLQVRQENLLVEIRDNGIGFDVEATQATYDQRTSLGLINMDERARLVGGRSTVKSARGKGTSVQVRVPLTDEVAEEA